MRLIQFITFLYAALHVSGDDTHTVYLPEYVPYRTHESSPTQQRERMVVDPVNQYQKL